MTDAAPGKVYLVGSGPGDPDLLTVKAKRLLEEADVVLHDKLPGPEIIGMIPEEKREDVANAPAASGRPRSTLTPDWSNSPRRVTPLSD